MPSSRKPKNPTQLRRKAQLAAQRAAAPRTGARFGAPPTPPRVVRRTPGR